MTLNSLAEVCVPSTFAPSVFGAEVVSLQASVVTNHAADVPDGLRHTAPSVHVENASFCNVTVTYTHPGYDDRVNIEAWLPLEDWNSRLTAFGGGGFVAGRHPLLSDLPMAAAVQDGFAAVTTDAGLEQTSNVRVSWALASTGNVNLHKLQNLGSTSLNDLAVMSKSLVASFYGKPPSYSYWEGCSQGGRQGLMLAQRYPTAFDGIAASAPGIDWTNLLTSLHWPEQVMRTLGETPYMCELDAITAAVIAKCDGLDGVNDGIVTDFDECKANFDPFDLVGKSIPCAQTGKDMPISRAAATVAHAAWEGMSSPDGKQLWHGVSVDTDLTGNGRSIYQPVIAATNCTEGRCVPVRNNLGANWVQRFLAKDSSFDLDSMTHEKFISLLRVSRQEYGSIMDTLDPDLSEFKEAGGKIVTYHGVADNLVPFKVTENYYESVSETVDNVQYFYRFFAIPGLGHCAGGYQQPTSLFAQLQAWVENGTAPDSSPVSFTSPDGVTQNRIICPWPKKSRFDASCGDPAKAECWACLTPESLLPVTTVN
ncbi:tannase and feruloyl esterase [Hypoxylon sp. FL1284]|nr:tannase and feruloyl esterase [Hypoxylon sp. FL1284]